MSRLRSMILPNDPVLYEFEKPVEHWLLTMPGMLDGAASRTIVQKITPPKITAKNAASITPEQWDAAYNAAVGRGDMVEAQRLRDLHFMAKAPGTKASTEGSPLTVYHGTTEPQFTVFDNSLRTTPSSKSDNIDFAHFFSNDENIASTYGKTEPYYLKMENPHEYDFEGRTWRNEDWSGISVMDSRNFEVLGEFDSVEDAEAFRKAFLKEHPEADADHINVYTDVYKGTLGKSTDEQVASAFGNGNDGAIFSNVVDYGSEGVGVDADFGKINYPADDYVVFNPKNIKSADAVIRDDAGNIIPLSQRDNFDVSDVRYESSPLGNQSNGKAFGTSGSLLSEEETAEIAKYANSQKNPVRQLKERMSDPEYEQMISDSSAPAFNVGMEPVYIEGKDRKDATETIEFFKNVIRGITNDPREQLRYYNGISNAVYGNSAFAVPHTPYAYIPKKRTMLSKSHIAQGESNADRQHQYLISKSHEGSHVYAHPQKQSPLHDYINGLDRNYFRDGNDAELSARGSQIKSYFDKKTISENELKYAAEHYVQDTGIDNQMTDMFNYIREAAKKDPGIWKKMAEWISKVSPVLVVGVVASQSGKED